MSIVRLFVLVILAVPCLSVGSVGCSARGGGSASGGQGGSNADGGGGSEGGPDAGSAGSAGSGGSISTGGSNTGGSGTGGSGTGGSGGEVTPGSYALPPPDQCENQFFVEGCVEGDPSSTCGGECSAVNACVDEGKSGEPGFACPRYMLFADEMLQASEDDAGRYGWSSDGSSPFNYAVVGHDTDTTANSVDDPDKSPCCQCYQLIPYLPEDQVTDQQTDEPTVPLPKPLVVQAFNTGATTKTFDVYMGSGGLGAFDACSPDGSGTDRVDHQYTSYPLDGQPSGGGIKAAGEFGNGTSCKTENNLVTSETLSSSGCQSLVEGACNEIEANVQSITTATRRSCIESNQADRLYHLNWQVHARRVQCPQGLTEVTGCKLVEDLPEVDPNVTTPEQAQGDSSFIDGYSTTTMQDCCKPSCGWQDQVTGEEGGHVADGLYNSFYTCTKDGAPMTEPE